MKKIVMLLMIFVMCLSITACGGNEGAENSAADAGSANEVVFEEGTVILENEYVKVELVKFYEEEFNWNGTDPSVEKCFTLKVTNLCDREMIFGFDEVYIADEGADLIMNDGNSGPLPGKSKTFSYCVQVNDEELESMDQIYELNGQIELNVMSADGEYIEFDKVEMFDFASVK